jgi:superfamily II DNA or RNA helicase
MTREEIQKKALQAVSRVKRAGLSISMGVGKTYIGLQYIDEHLINGDVLVVTPKRDIFQSWIDDAKKFNLEHLLDKITFSTYISLNKQDPSNFSIVILDEAHSTKGSHTEFLDNYDGRILGLTGTPPKWLQSEKGLMMQRFYPIAYSYEVDQAVEHSILNDYRIFIHKVELNTANTLETKQGWNTSERKNYEWLYRQIEDAPNDKQMFFKRIMCINALKQYESKEHYVRKCLTHIPPDEKCLIFANTIDQAERLCPNSHHSKKKNNNDLEDFKQGNITRLSAVEQLSEGVTIPGLKHIIIMHSYGNEKKASQKIGRALRLNPLETSKIHVLMYENTIDEKWVKTALEEFNPDKIKLTKIYTNGTN